MPYFNFPHTPLGSLPMRGKDNDKALGTGTTLLNAL